MSSFSVRFFLLPVSILLMQSVTFAQTDTGYFASDGEFMRLVEGGTFKMGATEKEKYLISASDHIRNKKSREVDHISPL